MSDNWKDEFTKVLEDKSNWAWKTLPVMRQRKRLVMSGYTGEYVGWSIILFKITRPSPPPKFIHFSRLDVPTHGCPWVMLVTGNWSGGKARIADSETARTVGEALEMDPPS